MIIFFEVLKWLFFIISIFFWLFFIKWKSFLDQNIFEIIKNFLMPGYLILCGIMIWYFITSFFAAKYENTNPEIVNKIYSRWFIFWLILWVVIAILNIYYK